MADSRYGPWDPLEPTELRDLFDGFDAPWWLTGGLALDRVVGRRTRDHEDVDFEVPRHALAAVLEHLPGWHPHTAHDGRLTPLARAGDHPLTAHNVWWRSEPDGPWRVDMQVGDVEGDDWVYRRHPAIRRPLASVWWVDTDDVPVVAPEVQLLFKARADRAKDTADGRLVVPMLDRAARVWLVGAVRAAHPDSPWLSWL